MSISDRLMKCPFQKSDNLMRKLFEERHDQQVGYWQHTQFPLPSMQDRSIVYVISQCVGILHCRDADHIYCMQESVVSTMLNGDFHEDSQQKVDSQADGGHNQSWL
jgi:hypothetical protein